MSAALLLVSLSAFAPADPPANPPAAPPAADPADAKYPLPQDRLLAADRLKRRVAWMREQWLGDFDRTADKAAPGYAEVRKAVELAAEADGRSGVRSATAVDARDRALRAAAKTATRDPLFWTLHSQHVLGPVVDDRMIQVGEEVAAGRYSPYVRTAVFFKAAADAHARGKDDARDPFVKLFAAALGELAADKDPTAAAVADEAIVRAVESPAFGGSAGRRHDALKRALAADAVPTRARELAAGKAWRQAAWDARGRGFADTVSDEQFKQFKQGLTAAEPHLTAAWKADPAQPMAAVGMVWVCIGLGRPRDEMETWFRRAMTAHPGSYLACSAKLHYLRPAWHGTDEQMLAFGRQCARLGRADGRLADVLYDAHLRVNRDGQPGYWKRPAVWADMKAAFEPAVAAHPADRQLRTRFAVAALAAGQPEVADAQLKAINDRVWRTEFATAAAAAGFRGEVDQALARKKEGKADEDDGP